jgi:hypothetical protein
MDNHTINGVCIATGKITMYCNHVYNDTGFDICPDCNEPTHEINWKEQAELHKEWIDSGKAVYGGWWSI